VAQQGKNQANQEVAKIVLDSIENAPVYYVNHIEVANSPQDFSLICARLPAKISKEKIEEVKQTGTLTVEPDVQIVIPTTLVPGLIKALTIQKEAYESMFKTQIKEVGDPHG
jgi:hypothetical protein